MPTPKEYLTQKMILQAATQDGSHEIVFVISPQEKKVLRTFTIGELKAIPDFGAKRVDIQVRGEE